jgi:hypothetical protein
MPARAMNTPPKNKICSSTKDLRDSLDSIPSPSVKIQIIGRKVYLR